MKLRTAILKALWEAEEQATAEAYARQPDSSEAAFDPAVFARWRERKVAKAIERVGKRRDGAADG